MQFNRLICSVLAAAVASMGSSLRAVQFTWNNSVGGDYSNVANWSGSGTFNSTGTALFNRGATGYTVNLTGNLNQAGLTFGNDQVTFALNGALYGASGSVPLQVGSGSSSSTAVFILQSNSTAVVAEPSFFNTSGAVIGSNSGAKGLVTVDNARGAIFWNNDGNLAIGGTSGGGTGSLLAINTGNSVATDGTLTLFSGSTLNINGGSLAMGTFDRRAGSTFIWSAGVLQITASAVTVNSGGLFQNGSTIGVGQELDAQLGLTIASGANLQLAGGTVSATTFANSGTFNFTSGTLAVTSSDVTINAGGLFNSGSALATGKSLVVTGNTTINAGSTLQLSGGTLNTGTLVVQPGGGLAFTAGTLQLTNSDLTIGPGGLLGSSLTLNAGRNVIVSPPINTPPNGVTTISAGGTLAIAGGTFSTAALSLAGGTFSFTSGTLALTQSNATIDAGGLMGTSSTFGTGRNLTVAGATIINAGATLTLSGGAIVTGGFLNSGSFNFTSGTLALNADDLHVGASGQLGGNVTLNTNMTLETDGGSLFNIDDASVLTLNGGTANATAIVLNGSGHIVFNSGTLGLTQSSFLVDPAGPLGGSLTLNAGQTVITAQATTISAGSHLTVAGGRLSTGTLPVTTSAFTFTSGEVDLTASMLGIISSGPFGNNLTLSAGKTVSVSDTTTIDGTGTLTISGGSFTAANIVNNGTLVFTSGTLHITRDPVTVGAIGIFGLAPTISAGKILIVDAPLAIQSGTTFTVNGGSATARIMYVGQGSSAAANVSAGSLNVTTSLVVGSVSSAAFSLSGTGVLNASKVQLTLTNGTFTQSGGTATMTDLVISSNVGNSLTVSGGVFTSAHTVSDGTIIQSGGTMNLGFVDGLGSISVSGNSVATADSIRQTSLSVSNNSVVSINPSIGSDSTSTLESIGFGGNGKLDLNNTSMAFYSTSGGKSADYGILMTLVNNGRAGGAWNGIGITSSAAQASYGAHGNSETTALAVVRNDLLAVPFTTFAGVPVDLDTILVKYTYVGDATLDGVLSIDDYLQLDRGFLKHLTGWQNGDFNNDGSINALDYALIDRAFLNQGSPLAEAMITQHTAEFGDLYLSALAVPEPASMLLVSLGAAGLLRRRR